MIPDEDLKEFYEEIDKKTGRKSPFSNKTLPNSEITWECFIWAKGPQYSACPFCEYNKKCGTIAGFLIEFESLLSELEKGGT